MRRFLTMTDAIIMTVVPTPAHSGHPRQIQRRRLVEVDWMAGLLVRGDDAGYIDALNKKL